MIADYSVDLGLIVLIISAALLFAFKRAASLHEYPKEQILYAFLLFGGALGGILTAGLIILFSLLAEDWQSLSLQSLDVAIIAQSLLGGVGLFGIAGAFIGLIPAVITGIIITEKRYTLTTPSQYLSVFIIGFLVSLPMVLLVHYLFFEEILITIKEFLFILAPCISGGLSAVILLRLFVPNRSLHQK